ncbi:hypothetical protein GCM10011575_09770 [Microlunatus endophyticus]|uniref:Uncharacterized protein n=1 Tax=Microlunatus endophyticus TaxID=1716077 RepID=A0A917S4A0_9ACTN|nr:hypothetical protein [Microlunatus endophyticus]GGL53405.1 hypothetical protein GCM10011575_09770 [Microlunatus endophyticus]
MLVAELVWFGLLSAVAGSATGAGFGMVAAVAWWGLRYLGRIGDGFAGWFLGSRVALIEVKLWQPGIYSWDGPLAVLYYGERFRGGSVELSTAASLCRAQLGPDVDVRAWIVVVPGGESDRHTYVLDNTGAPEGINLCRTDDLDTVREWLADARNEIDPALIQTLVSAHKLHLASTKPAPGAAHHRNRVKVLPGHSASRAPER